MRRGDTEVGRIEDVLGVTVSDRRTQQDLGGHRKGDREAHRREPLVGVKQHATGETGDYARGQEVQEIAGASPEAQFAIVGTGIDPLQQHRNQDGGDDGGDRGRPRLLKAQHGVAHHVPDDHQRREIPPREEPPLGIVLRVEQQRRVEERVPHGAAFASATGRERVATSVPSNWTVCQLGTSDAVRC